MSTNLNNRTRKNGSASPTALPVVPLPSAMSHGAAPAPLDAVASGTPVTRRTPAGAFSMVDLIARIRDKWGHRLPWSYSYPVPIADNVPLEKTPLIKAVELIAEKFPIRAREIHHFFNEKLLFAFGNVHKVVTEVENELALAQRGAVEANMAVETACADLERERDAATETDRAADRALDAPLAAAHLLAADRVAKAGGSYDSNNPDPACVLRHTRKPLEVIAGDLRAPWTADGARPHMHPALSWGFTVLVGMIIGVSLGIYAKALHASSLPREGMLIAAFAVVGFAVAATAKFALRALWSLAAQDCFLPAGAARCAAMVSAAGSISLALFAGDLCLERIGLLAAQISMLAVMSTALTGSTAGNAGGDGLASLVSWLAPVIVTLGYIVCASVEGWCEGRHRALTNRLLARQDALHEQADIDIRHQDLVQSALAAIAAVKHLLWRRNTLRERIAATAAPFDLKIADQQARRKIVPEDISESGLKRIQEALDAVHGAQCEFNRMFTAMRDACEPIGSGWVRFWPYGRRRQPRRRSERDEKG